MVKKIISQIKNNKVAFLLAFVAVGTIIGPLAFNTYLYYAALAIFFIANANGFKPSFMWAYGLLIAGALASIMLNDTMPEFKADQRLLLFILISLPISPMFSNRKLRIGRLRAFNYVLILSTLTGIGSLVAYFLGVNYMFNFVTGDNSVNNTGWFGGITFHSMLLGPVSALGATYATWFMTGQTFKTKWHRYLAIAVIFACIAAAMLSASRGSTIAAIVGSAVVFLLRKGNSGNKIVGSIIGLMLLGALAQPLMKPFMAGIMEKQNNSIESGGTFSSRERKWNSRINEFISSPVYGSGFATVSKESGDYSTIDGIVEPGTSWLAVLSMLGIVGGISIYLIVFKPMIAICKKINHVGVLLFGIFCVFLLHMMTEGYIFAGGSFMFFYFWLFIGAVHAYLDTPNYEMF